ncbi:MAG: hypothetical protein AAGD32_02975 [Planctomycetota bacterium]
MKTTLSIIVLILAIIVAIAVVVLGPLPGNTANHNFSGEKEAAIAFEKEKEAFERMSGMLYVELSSGDTGGPGRIDVDLARERFGVEYARGEDVSELIPHIFPNGQYTFLPIDAPDIFIRSNTTYETASGKKRFALRLDGAVLNLAEPDRPYWAVPETRAD